MVVGYSGMGMGWYANVAKRGILERLVHRPLRNNSDGALPCTRVPRNLTEGLVYFECPVALRSIAAKMTAPV